MNYGFPVNSNGAKRLLVLLPVSTMGPHVQSECLQLSPHCHPLALLPDAEFSRVAFSGDTVWLGSQSTAEVSEERQLMTAILQIFYFHVMGMNTVMDFIQC